MNAIFELQVVFDQASLDRIAQLANVDIRFNSHIMEAIGRSLPEVQDAATAWMFANFKNPSGALESAWDMQMLDWSIGALINEEVYGRRRNWGFSGMTDSLGRTYSYDPGIEWAENAIELSAPYIERIFQEELEVAASGF